MNELQKLRETNEFLIGENKRLEQGNNRLEQENKKLKDKVEYLKLSCKQFAHQWIKTFNPKHQLVIKK